jgi:D-alanyl-D-alanine carboxypeptidase/D-alanyl-D-alanine-endopeptidase (penicillin-binding protein 4)
VTDQPGDQTQQPSPQPLSRRAARAGAAAGPPESANDGAPKRSGFAALVEQHPRAWLFSSLAVIFVLLGTGAVFAGVSLGSTKANADVVAVVPTATVVPPRPTPTPLSTATALRTCSIAGKAGSASLGAFSGTVINTATGEALFDRAGSAGVATASVMKLLTSATALSVLGPDYRFTTSVYAGATPGSVVLVGGGDPTLSALPAGQESVYKGAPKLDDLAAQVKAAWDKLNPGQPITSVILDANMWDPNDNWDPSWPATERTQGYQPLITALMVDGDRANPQAQNSPRSTDPIGAAGAAFVSALGLPGDTKVSQGSAITSNPQLGQVQSQPISALIGQMLPISDNTLAEMMDRVSSKVGGRDGSSGSLTPLVQSALSGYGLDVTGLVIKDGSGESYLDAVAPALVAKLMVMVNAGTKGLDVIYNALPVSGKSGTLASRFTGANAVARGAVNAKTGSIATAYALAGIVHAADGTALSFAFFAEGKLSAGAAMSALDTVTTAVFTCGNNLSNN